MKSRTVLSRIVFAGLFTFSLGLPLLSRAEDRPAKSSEVGGEKKVMFLAGGPSHGYAQHEHRAGCLLLAKCLSEGVPGVKTVVQSGWPKDPSILEDADTIVIYGDGGGGHLAMPHLKDLDRLMKKGIGLACLHYAVEIPKGEPGDLLKSWIGGYYETFWSVNPTYTAVFKSLPDHPIARGVKPFTITDEWYYHMRFQDGMKRVTPILTTVPPDSTRQGGDDAHGGNPTVRAEKGHAEHVAWAFQRSGGGRGFGFTGGHFHWNWGNDNFRKVVLNAILWTAHGEVPAGGVSSTTPTLAELEANQDKPKPANLDEKQLQKELDDWNAAK
jgi:type 1 glutamine amidotransferase